MKKALFIVTFIITLLVVGISVFLLQHPTKDQDVNAGKTTNSNTNVNQNSQTAQDADIVSSILTQDDQSVMTAAADSATAADTEFSDGALNDLG